MRKGKNTGDEGLNLHLSIGSSQSTFDLEKAVCSHGFFMMAPNNWDPTSKTLQRPFRLFSDSTTSISVRISQPDADDMSLRIHLPVKIASKDQDVLLDQVARMLRISEKDEEDMRKFHSIHPEAKSRNFGRVIRSPTLFEDIVKSILLQNCGWGRSLEMASALCGLQLKLKKRKRDEEEAICGDFPSWKELSNVDQDLLERECKLGYRAGTILRVVAGIGSGRIRLVDESCDAVVVALKRIKGFGDFTCRYVLTCMGRYNKIPADSETFRHIREHHKRTRPGRKVVERIYGKYRRFQYLAYWFELWGCYEAKFGKLSELPRDSYKFVTGSRNSSII